MLDKSTEKKIKKLFKKKDFIFLIIFYPVIIIMYFIAKSKMSGIIFTYETGKSYTIASFIILLFILVYTLYERIDKKLSNKRQGDILRFKQRDKSWMNK